MMTIFPRACWSGRNEAERLEGGVGALTMHRGLVVGNKFRVLDFTKGCLEDVASLVEELVRKDILGNMGTKAKSCGTWDPMLSGIEGEVCRGSDAAKAGAMSLGHRCL